MLTDPLSVTYDGSSLSCPRIAVGKNYTRYSTADGLFVVFITASLAKGGIGRVDVIFSNQMPDPTPSNVFDDYRAIRNSFGFSYAFDPSTKANASVDIPKLRTALNSWMTSTLEGRIIAGER